MLGEVTHLQTISDDLKALTSDPHKLPPASEQVRTYTKDETALGYTTNLHLLVRDDLGLVTFLGLNTAVFRAVPLHNYALELICPSLSGDLGP